jgi:hypothetical protein
MEGNENLAYSMKGRHHTARRHKADTHFNMRIDFIRLVYYNIMY